MSRRRLVLMKPHKGGTQTVGFICILQRGIESHSCIAEHHTRETRNVSSSGVVKINQRVSLESLQWAVARAGGKDAALWARRPLLRRRGAMVTVKALQDDVGSIGAQRGRLVDFVRRIPAAVDKYFDKSPFRRALWGGISLLGGFYVAQTISLSFGALGVNDVIAAVLCMLFTELLYSP